MLAGYGNHALLAKHEISQLSEEFSPNYAGLIANRCRASR